MPPTRARVSWSTSATSARWCVESAARRLDICEASAASTASSWRLNLSLSYTRSSLSLQPMGRAGCESTTHRSSGGQGGCESIRSQKQGAYPKDEVQGPY